MPGHGPILLHNTVSVMPTGKRILSFTKQRAALMLTPPTEKTTMAYKIPSCAHTHSQHDTTQGKIPEADFFFHHLTTSYPNTKQLLGLFFNKYEW